MHNILIFEAHADDTIIGMGGTVQKLKAEGYTITVITFTKGETAYSTEDLKDKIVDIRLQENSSALKIVGVDEHINWDCGCQAVMNDRETHQKCIEMIRKYTPEIIFTHSPEDKHRDHRAISATVTEAWWKATEAVLADRGPPHRAKKLFYFETTELFTHPDVVIGIDSFFEKKIRAMREYQSQFKVMEGLISYVEGVAKSRGLYTDGIYGEAFLKSDFLPSNDF